MTTYYEETIQLAREAATPAAELFNSIVSEALGDNFVANARFGVILGPIMVFDVHEKNYANNIIQNTNARLHLIVHIATGSSFGRDSIGSGLELTNVKAELVTSSWKLRENGLKYRVIKSNAGLTALAQKVAEWVVKNKEIFEKSA